MVKKYFGIFVLLIFAVSLFGCGRGGGGDATQNPAPNPAPITNATSESVTAITSTKEFSGAMEIGGQPIGYESQPKLKKQRLSRMVAPLISKKRALIWTPSCKMGGSVDVTGVQSTDKKTVTITAVFNSCADGYGFVDGNCPSGSRCSKDTYTGKIVGKYTNPNWTETITNPASPPDDFIAGINKIEGTYTDWKDAYEYYDGATKESYSDSTVNGSIVIDIKSQDKTSFTFNIVVSGKGVEEGITEAGTFTYSLGMVVEKLTEGGNEIVQTTVNGGLTLHLTKPSSRKESISYTNYVVKEWEVTGGTESTIDGGMTLNLACIKGKVTVTTKEVIFTPKWRQCPTAGELTISGSGTATVEYTSTGGVKIYVDDNLVKEAGSCDDLEVCDGESLFACTTPWYDNRKLMIAKVAGCKWNKS